MGRVKTLKRREQAVRLKEKRQQAEGGAQAKKEAVAQADAQATSFEHGWKHGFYDGAKTCANVAKESSNIRKAREGIATVAHNAKRGVEAIGG